MRNGMPVSVTRAVEELRKYRKDLQVMRGGFTLSGGEPLMQHRFTSRLLGAVKAMGVHTALDTNGYFGDLPTDADLANIDLVLLDIKAWEPERYKRYVGMEIGPTLDFARRLAALRRPVWIRHVVVPGWTDDEDTARQMARFVASLAVVQRVDVLPFHQIGRYKWEALGKTYQLADVEPASEDSVARSVAIFRSEGLQAW